MKTEAFNRCINVGVTAAGGKILAAPNNLLTILKGEKTLVIVHFIASCNFDHHPEIVGAGDTEQEEGVDTEAEDDSGDETTLGEQTSLEPATPSADAESSFESYTGHGFTQEIR